MTQVTPLQRKALLLAAALSGFTLVLVGAVAGRIVSDPLRSATVPTAMTLPTPPPTPGPDPVVQALLDQRAAEYQTMIQQANDRLAQANRQLRQAYSAAAVAAARPAAPPPPAYLSAERAAQIASLVAPGANLTRTPELVNFQGAAAFEVVLDAGTLYIDAASGQVLYNGVATMVAASGGGGGGGEHEHEHEHEDEDEEGDDG